MKNYNYIQLHVSFGGMSPVDNRMKKYDTFLELRVVKRNEAQEG